ncbi:MFS transporter [Sphingobium amiense]|uniref:MFS transporter n=1 Tax=Sphingobium amiense TaxID=135719 RepID=A0A494W6D5_9SPHN|nr:MFS transporter [Sphingobium amiense]BBD98127.1 MFS transporter [Sphingobium amiense]
MTLSSRTPRAVIAVLFTTYLVCYLDRLVMASAIPFIAKDLQFSATESGAVMSAFFAGYALMQIPGGMLADRYGPRRILTCAILLWSVFTALTALATSMVSLVVVRILFGVTEGAAPSAVSKAVRIWAPGQVGRVNGLLLGATQLGPALAPLFVATLIVDWGWRGVFFSLLVPGLILAAFVFRVVGDRRDDAAAEPEHVATTAPLPAGRSSLGHILRCQPILWSVGCAIFASVANWGMMSWIPTYLLTRFGLSIKDMGIAAAMPFLTAAIGYYLGGHIGDRLFPHRRGLPIAIGLFLASLATLSLTVASTAFAATAAFMLIYFFLSIALSCLFSLPLAVMPAPLVATSFSVVNGGAQIGAFLAPISIGAILDGSRNNFTLVFATLVIVLAVGGVMALLIRPERRDDLLSPGGMATA